MKKFSRRMAFAALLVVTANSFAQINDEQNFSSNMLPSDFALTRVYMLAPRQFAVRLLGESSWKRDVGFIQEGSPMIFAGLPGRLQLSLHQVSVYEDGSFSHNSIVPEVRWALGKYGAIPLNPVVGLGFSMESNPPNTLKGILQLSQPFAEHWLYASNFLYERKTGGPVEVEYILYNGIRRSVKNADIGLELKTEYTTQLKPESGFKPFYEWLAGPSFGQKIGKNFTLRINSVFGLNGTSPHNESNVLFIYALK